MPRARAVRSVPLLALLLVSACSGPAPAAPGPSPASDPVVVSPTPSASAPVVVLDPGHNGANSAHPEVVDALVPAGGFDKPCNTMGTETDAGYPEHAFTFDVARRSADLLRARGVTVVLTRTDDTGVGPCVDARAALAQEVGAALAVSVHADGAPADERGFHVVEPALAPDGGNAAVLAPSDVAARDLRDAVSAATGLPPAQYPGGLLEPGLARRSDLAGLNLARTPAVLLEAGNMRNAQEAALLTDPVFRQRVAEGIAAGVSSFLVRSGG